MIKPIKGKIAVTKQATSKTTESGIILTVDVNDVDRAIVVAVAADVEDIKVGDELLIDWKHTTKTRLDEQDVYIINEKDVVGIFED